MFSKPWNYVRQDNPEAKQKISIYFSLKLRYMFCIWNDSPAKEEQNNTSWKTIFMMQIFVAVIIFRPAIFSFLRCGYEQLGNKMLLSFLTAPVSIELCDS